MGVVGFNIVVFIGLQKEARLAAGSKPGKRRRGPSIAFIRTTRLPMGDGHSSDDDAAPRREMNSESRSDSDDDPGVVITHHTIAPPATPKPGKVDRRATHVAHMLQHHTPGARELFRRSARYSVDTPSPGNTPVVSQRSLTGQP